MEFEYKKALSILNTKSILKLAILQVFSTLTAFYCLTLLLAFLMDKIWGLRFHSAQIFSFAAFSRTSQYLYPTSLAFLMNIPFLSLAYIFFVGKAKKVLEFVATTAAIHYLISALRSRHLGTFPFFVVFGIYNIIAILSIEWICLKVEQSESFNFQGLLEVSSLFGGKPKYESLKVIEI